MVVKLWHRENEKSANSPGSGSFIVWHVLGGVVGDDDLSLGVWVGKWWKINRKWNQKWGKLHDPITFVLICLGWISFWMINKIYKKIPNRKTSFCLVHKAAYGRHASRNKSTHSWNKSARLINLMRQQCSLFWWSRPKKKVRYRKCRRVILHLTGAGPC